MNAAEVVVIGGGPAGVAAAVDLGRAGLEVTLYEQGRQLGGAIHRQPNDPSRRAWAPRAQERRWMSLSRDIAGSGVRVRTRHAFLGLEGSGAILVEDRREGTTITRRPAALVLALGGLERVAPVPGAHLPGVVTAGGMQVMLKETGRPPEGAVLIAGSGPLLVALAAQIVALGNRSVVVLERSPAVASPWLAAKLAMAPAYLAEAASYMLRLSAAGVAWRRGMSIRSITPAADGRLEVSATDLAGRESRFAVDRVALHDGLRARDWGLPSASAGGPFVVTAGDCREALGGVAAIADGRVAAASVVAHLRGVIPAVAAAQKIVARERRVQAALAQHFDFAGPDLSGLPDETVVCRCEGRTLGDLRQLLACDDQVSAREVKLNGRFAMGACQGKFCAEWVARVLASHHGVAPPPNSEFTGSRWPVKPVPVSALIAVKPAGTPSSDPD